VADALANLVEQTLANSSHQCRFQIIINDGSTRAYYHNFNIGIVRRAIRDGQINVVDNPGKLAMNVAAAGYDSKGNPFVNEPPHTLYINSSKLNGPWGKSSIAHEAAHMIGDCLALSMLTKGTDELCGFLLQTMYMDYQSQCYEYDRAVISDPDYLAVYRECGKAIGKLGLVSLPSGGESPDLISRDDVLSARNAVIKKYTDAQGALGWRPEDTTGYLGVPGVLAH
jgi:hypothetical protein